MAKGKLTEMLACLPELRGVGIAMLDGGFGLKVNLETETTVPIPSEIDGVPVVVEVVGGIQPR